MIEFSLDKIEDTYVREVLQRIREEFKNQVLLRGQWRFVEINIGSDVTELTYSHKLGFSPTDLIQTSKTGTGTVTWNYTLFDSTNLNLTTSGTDPDDPIIVRAFVGRYEEGGIV